MLIEQVVDCFKISKDNLPKVQPEKRYYLDLTKEMVKEFSPETDAAPDGYIDVKLLM